MAFPPSRRSQRGFTMALALALVVAMGILLMKARPAVAAQIQRENEAELIFRGEAIAQALRIYAAKQGRYPASLDELMKVKPRILRQKYRDPMTKAGDWTLVTQVQPGASGNTEGLPIVGVRSRSEANGIHLYQGKALVKEWSFVADANILGLGQGGEATRLPRKGDVQAAPPARKE